MRAYITSTARICAKCRQPSTSAAAAAAASRTFATATAGTTTSSSPRTAASSSTPTSSRNLAQTRCMSSTRAARYPEPSSSPSEPTRKIPQTHYDFFPESLPDGPPPKGHFPIDQRALRREFLRLQAKAHPDMHPAEHKARAEATSARINEAYNALSNPLHRAQYLLALRGVDVANDETLKVEDPELLMMVLEAREAIEEAAEESDLDGIRAENDERIRESEEVLERAFREDDMELAKTEAVKLRYWVNIKDSVDGWEKGKPVVLEH